MNDTITLGRDVLYKDILATLAAMSLSNSMGITFDFDEMHRITTLVIKEMESKVKTKKKLVKKKTTKKKTK